VDITNQNYFMKKFSSLLLCAVICSITSGQVTEVTTNVNIPPVAAACCNPPNVGINIPVSNTIVFNADNTLTLSQTITVSTAPAKMITSIQAELIYFEFVPESEECLACNKNSATFGNFQKGMIASTPGVGAGTHSMVSSFSSPKAAGNFPLSLNITLPPVVKCCETVVRWCIRYVIFFDDCSVCSKVVCYEKKRMGTMAGNNSQPTKSN
jgi:hypothetical protein